jgi:hypothetical protein
MVVIVLLIGFVVVLLINVELFLQAVSSDQLVAQW